MEDFSLRDELEMRMNPEDFSISSNDLIDILNTFKIDEETLVQEYSNLVEEKENELKYSVREVLEYFRNNENYYPSFEEFMVEFKNYDDSYINTNTLRNMFNQETKNENQMSLFEIQKIIKEEVRSIHELYNSNEFDDEISRVEKNWGGAIDPEEEFDAEEFFGAAGDAAENDIKAEFGDDEFAPFGTMEDPRMLKNLEEDDVVDQKGLLQPGDSKGNPIKLKSLVSSIDGVKRGYVLGFGDDGQGGLTIRVDWKFPVDMKFMNPEEMGEKKEMPENLIVQNMKTKNMNEEINEEFESCETEDDEETLDETGRGLGKAVHNTGDRNVKMNDDHSAAPLTNLNESINKSIKNLMENKVTKKQLKEFIAEEAKKVAKQLKG